MFPLKTYWIYGNRFCSIEINYLEDQEVLHTVVAKKNNAEFKNLIFFKNRDISELANNLKNNQHSFLTINNDKVLIKEGPVLIKNEDIISQTFPSVAIDDFYYEILLSEGKTFVAICRKEYIDGLIQKFKKEKIEIIGIHLGFLKLSHLIPFIKKQKVISTNFQFDIHHNCIINYTRRVDSPSIYDIEEIKVESDFLISVSGLFGYISKLEKIKSNLIEKNSSLFSHYTRKNFFKKGIISALTFLLLTLLINFFLFSFFFEKNKNLKIEYDLLKAENSNYAITLEQTEIVEKIVKNISSGNSRTSFYINRIVVNTPNSILFNEIDFQPLLKSIRVEREIEYQDNILIIDGVSNDKNEFSQWLDKIEKLQWIKNVTIFDYKFKDDNTSSFKVKLEIKDDTKK